MLSKSLVLLQVGLSTILFSFKAMAADEVRLAWAYSVQCPPISGCYKSEGLKGVVEVKNLAFDKQLDIVYKPAWSNGWLSAPAEYLAPSDTGYEAWTFKVAGPIEAFALSYRVKGQTFWDNNNGQDYKLARYRNDAQLGKDKKLGGMFGVKHENSDSLYAFVLANPKQLTQRNVSVSIQSSGLNLEVPAALSETLPSGVELWLVKVPVEEPLREEEFRLSSTADGSRDDNFGYFYRIRDRLITTR